MSKRKCQNPRCLGGTIYNNSSWYDCPDCKGTGYVDDHIVESNEIVSPKVIEVSGCGKCPLIDFATKDEGGEYRIYNICSKDHEKREINFDYYYNSYPDFCPLRKQPVILKLKSE